MFLFIVNKNHWIKKVFLFKYISCSYLSNQMWLSVHNFQNLNTSHVLIYHANFNKDCWYVTLFKYISCSYLSGIDMDWNTTDFIFKYISCSYLSPCLPRSTMVSINLNTSHVLIYPTFLRTSCFL